MSSALCPWIGFFEGRAPCSVPPGLVSPGLVPLAWFPLARSLLAWFPLARFPLACFLRARSPLKLIFKKLAKRFIYYLALQPGPFRRHISVHFSMKENYNCQYHNTCRGSTQSKNARSQNPHRTKCNAEQLNLYLICSPAEHPTPRALRVTPSRSHVSKLSAPSIQDHPCHQLLMISNSLRCSG